MRLKILLVIALVGCGPSQDIEVVTSMKTDLAFAFYPLADASIGTTRYRDRFPEVWTRFGPAMPPAVLPVLDALRALKNEQGMLYGSSFARLFLRLEVESIAGLRARLEADDPEVLAEIDSWGPGMLQLYQQGGFKPGVLGILEALEGAGFERWWRESIEPQLLVKADELRTAGLREIQVNEEIARWAEHPARGGPIRVIPVAFMLYQGQQVMFPDRPGLRYLADASWSTDEFKLQLVHEVAHNQLLSWSDPEVKAAAAVLGQDAFFRGVFEGQKVSSGYVVLEDFVEENVTEAAQMLMAARLGLAVDARVYLRGHDHGSHVLSQALLQLIAEQGWTPDGAEPFQQFFLRMVTSGELGPGTIEPLRGRFLGG